MIVLWVYLISAVRKIKSSRNCMSTYITARNEHSNKKSLGMVYISVCEGKHKFYYFKHILWIKEPNIH